MTQLPPLISDLGIILLTAGIVTILFKKIGQPVVLGYIIAGFIVNSNYWFMPTISDLPNIQVWAEIGVIFLLFALGLEFSFKKLLKVGGPSTIAAIIEVSAMMLIGFATGKFLNWSIIDSLFLGGILAISSTTIIIRTLNESGMKGRGFVDYVFGILIVEDMVAVLLLVILSTVALTNQLSGRELIYSALKLIFFVILCFISGIFILPTLLKSIRKTLTEEMLLIISLAACFLIVMISSKAGFSPALGAFLVGSILAETHEVKKIEALILPVKNLFAAIFFVSVGMLIKPDSLIENRNIIFALTFLTIFGKFFSILIGSLVSKRSLGHSIQAGLSLAQIGEFSFIIAGLGIKLKVTSQFLYPIAVGVSVITTFITPYLIRNIDPIRLWIEKYIPLAAHEKIKVNDLATKTNSKDYSSSKKTFIAASIYIISNLVIILGISYFSKLLFNSIPHISLLITQLLTAPFFWALWQKPQSLLQNNNFLTVIPKSVTVILYILILQTYQLNNSYLILNIILFFCLLLFAAPQLELIYEKLEKHLKNNYNEKDVVTQTTSFGSWDAHISYLDILPESEVAGKTLHELKIRETFGASIALIERGHLFITAPGRDEKLFPNDRVAIIGNEKMIANLAIYLKSSKTYSSSQKIANYALHKIQVNEKMPFVFKTIRKSGIREKTDGLVVGIERHGEKILNPDSMLKILPNDLLWIVGDSSKIEILNQCPQ
ncbi:MAG: cation:proton antiporter [Bacteriovorax sp.]|nr:cation:proton antiporter [Bacteriovorax sp.]